MHIPIPIPIANRHVAQVHSRVLRIIDCEYCLEAFAFCLNLEAEGDDHDVLFFDPKGSEERASNKAHENLARKSTNLVVPIPCPNCGSYQQDMSQLLKDDASINKVQIIGGLTIGVAWLPFAFGSGFGWVAALAGSSLGFATMIYGYYVSAKFDPNSGDPEPRRLLARSTTVYGEELLQLIKERDSLPQ